MFIAQRFARDLSDLTDGYVNWREKFWWPEKQVGTPWFAGTLLDSISAAVNFNNDELEKVQRLAWIFLIQLVICCFAYVVACAGLICDTGEGQSKKKSRFVFLEFNNLSNSMVLALAVWELISGA